MTIINLPGNGSISYQLWRILYYAKDGLKVHEAYRSVENTLALNNIQKSVRYENDGSKIMEARIRAARNILNKYGFLIKGKRGKWILNNYGIEKFEELHGFVTEFEKANN